MLQRCLSTFNFLIHSGGPGPKRARARRISVWVGTLTSLGVVLSVGGGCSSPADPLGGGGTTSTLDGQNTGGGSSVTTASGGALVNGASGGTGSVSSETGSGGALNQGTGSDSGSGGVQGTPAIPYEQGFSPTTISIEDARAAYDDWKTIHLENCNDGAYRVRWENERLDATVSEGIGYGMLLTVVWDDQEAFNGLYEYYKRGRNQYTGLMNWLRYGCDAHSDTKYNPYPDGAAADADLDVAMSLIMADCKWGDSQYANEAGIVIRAIHDHMFAEDGGKHLLLPGDSGWFHDMGGGCVNYSYFAPAYYREFAQYDSENATFWNEAATQTYEFLSAGSDSATGLVRNWGSSDGNNSSCHDSYIRDDYNPAGYGDDAARTPWRIVTDYLWNAAPEAKSWTDKVTAWLNVVGIQNTVQWYHVDGNPDMGPTTWNNHTAINVGPWAAGAMSSDQASVDTFAAELKKIPSGAGDHDGEYFPRMLKALSMATLAGKFTSCGGAPR